MAAMMSFNAEKSCHLVSAHERADERLLGAYAQ